MYVYYDPERLIANHAVCVHDASYDPAINGECYVEMDDSVALSRVQITRRADGSIEASVKEDMPVVLRDTTVALGSEALFENVPRGAAIRINGGDRTIMDGSGTLEFTPVSAGFYAFAITCAGYMDWSARLEVIGGH